MDIDAQDDWDKIIDRGWKGRGYKGGFIGDGMGAGKSGGTDRQPIADQMVDMVHSIVERKGNKRTTGEITKDCRRSK